jgi:hypothetical protein
MREIETILQMQPFRSVRKGSVGKTKAIDASHLNQTKKAPAPRGRPKPNTIFDAYDCPNYRLVFDNDEFELFSKGRDSSAMSSHVAIEGFSAGAAVQRTAVKSGVLFRKPQPDGSPRSMFTTGDYENVRSRCDINIIVVLPSHIGNAMLTYYSRSDL